MKKMGVSEKMIKVIKSTLHNTTAILNVEGEQREIMIAEGTGQGTTLGPILCNFFLLPLLLHWQRLWSSRATKLREVNGHTTDSFLHNFADDMAIITRSRSEAKATATQLHNYLQDFLVDIHVATPEQTKSKSVCLFIPANKHEIEESFNEPLMINEQKRYCINFVDQAKYLGHIISKNLLDDSHIQSRMAKASQVFGALRHQLFGKKEVWKNVKQKVLETMIIPTLLDGIECCAVSTKMMSDMETIYMRWVRNCMRITPYTQRKFKLTSISLLEKLGMRPLHYYLDMKILAYAGHIERMPNYRLPKIAKNCSLQGPRKRGRPPTSSLKNIRDGLKRKEIDTSNWKTLAYDKKKWAKMIRRNRNKNANAKTKKTKILPIWATTPTMIIGQHVEKQFGSKWHVGQIKNVDIDEHTNETIWLVMYDDGDAEDCNITELAKILCLDMHTVL
jgi:hypothetical protein